MAQRLRREVLLQFDERKTVILDGRAWKVKRLGTLMEILIFDYLNQNLNAMCNFLFLPRDLKFRLLIKRVS